MHTKYCILSALIRPEIQEKISIGMLLFDDNEVYFRYSKNKLHVAKSLLTKSAFKLLKDILENIEEKIEINSTDYSEKRGFKIFKNKAFDDSFSASYISYLSRYSNNTISFTAPKEIGLKTSNQSFKDLFSKYIDNSVEMPIVENKIKIFDVIKEKYADKISIHFDINKEVTHQQVKNLITPVRVDFTGRNEIDVYVQTVDMESAHTSVANHINSFIQLKSTYIRNDIPLKDFFIAKEPQKKLFPKQHDMWIQLRSSNFLSYLDFSESEAIIKYAESHGVVPLSTAL